MPANIEATEEEKLFFRLTEFTHEGSTAFYLVLK